MILAGAALAAPVTLVAVGDVLPHRRVKASAAEGWAAVLGPVSERIRAADVAFANL